MLDPMQQEVLIKQGREDIHGEGKRVIYMKFAESM